MIKFNLPQVHDKDNQEPFQEFLICIATKRGSLEVIATCNWTQFCSFVRNISHNDQPQLTFNHLTSGVGVCDLGTI